MALLAACLLALLPLLVTAKSDLAGCDRFVRGGICSLTVDNVLDIDSRFVRTETECQQACLADKECNFFSFFMMKEERKCVLFLTCDEKFECSSCMTGPAKPTMDECHRKEALMAKMSEDQKEGEDTETETKTEADKKKEDKPRYQANAATEASTSATSSTSTTTESEAESDIEDLGSDSEKASVSPTASSNERDLLKAMLQAAARKPKQLDDDEDEDASKDSKDGKNPKEDTFAVEGIDDGLLQGEEDPVDALEPPRQRERPSKKKNQEDKEDADEEDNKKEKAADEDDEKEDTDGDKKKVDADEDEAFPPDYFDEDAETASKGNSSGGRRPDSVYCVLGGYNEVGAIPFVSQVLQRRSRQRVLPSLPPGFPLGSQGIYGTVVPASSLTSSASLLACSPGAASTVSSAPLLQPFGAGQLQATGGCYAYSDPNVGWQPAGSAMNTYRGGGTITKMGNYIVAMGGTGFPSALNSIEVLDVRRPRKWRTLSQVGLPSPTYDHCAVAINKTALFVAGGQGQESQALVMDLKGKNWQPLEPMKQPRRQHSCLRASVNGRDGVIVAGGASDANAALSSVEFYDLDQASWLSLGRLRQPRRFPGMLVLGGQLIVAGGETTDSLGRTVILDDMETLRKKSWRPVAQKLSEPRSRFSVVQIPRSFFF